VTVRSSDGQSGLPRGGELLALRWSDVDLDKGLVHVRHNVQRLPEVGLVYGSPKTGRSRRTVPLPARSVKVLRTHRARQAAEALTLGPRWPNTGLVFTSTVGTVIEPRNLSRLFDELMAAAGVRRIRHSRSAAHVRFPASRPGRPTAGRDGRARPFADGDHDGPLLARHADRVAGGC
jgi:integrase